MTEVTALTPQNPWPGLRAFGEGDSAFFFGRERETADLLALLQRATVVVLYGQSGLGKTSLLQAALFPAVRESGLTPFRVRLDHGDAAPPLADQLKDALSEALDAARVSGPRPGSAETLWEYFHRRDQDLWGPRNRLVKPLIVLDQFEEMFTLGQRTEAAVARVAAFVDELEALLEHRPPQAVRERLDRDPDSSLKYDFQREGVRLVISLREDFLAQLDTWRVRMPSLLPNRYRLERLSGAKALTVVCGAGGDLVDDDVARDIVDFVSRSQRRAYAATLQQRSVEPALLSVVCDELNRQRIKRGEPRLTADLISGERGAIIQNFYDRAFDDIDSSVRDWVEASLLTSSGYRDRAALEDALKAGLDESAFERLVERRILHREERDGVIWLELTHDLLTDPAVASRLARQQNRTAAEAFRRERETARQLNRARALAGVFGVLLLATVVALIYAFRMSHEAERTSNEATILKQAADANATRAEQQAGLATSSFNLGLNMADESGQTQLDNERRDMRMQTPNLIKVIESADQFYDKLATQAPSADLTDRHARFLATAAQALYQTGHLKEGLTLADHGLALLAHDTGQNTPARQAVRAEVLSARGTGRASVGQSAAAVQDFTEAIGLVKSASDAGGWTDNLARAHVQAQQAWGEVELTEMSYASAAARFGALLSFLDAHRSSDADTQLEREAWRVAALVRLSQAHAVAADAALWLAKADDAIGRLISHDPANLRWTRLASEAAYQRGRVARRLGQDREAVTFFARATEASDFLIKHDPENLEWKLNAVQARRGEGFRLDTLEDPGRERAALVAAAKDAADLIKDQPDWRRAHYLRAAALDDLADSYKAVEYFDRTQVMFEDAAAEFAGNVRRDPNDLESTRGVSLTYTHLASDLYVRGEYAAAVRTYSRALDGLKPAVRPATALSFVPTDEAYALKWMANAWAYQKNWTEAGSEFARAAETLEKVVESEPKAANFDTLADLYVTWGEMLATSGDRAAAGARYDGAADAAAKSRKADPASTQGIHTSVTVEWQRSILLVASGNPAGAVDRLDKARAVLWSALEQESWNTTLQNDLNGINAYLKNLKGTQPAGSASPSDLVVRIDRLLAERQPSELTAWVMPPIVPGAWRNLTGEELHSSRKQVVAAFPRFLLTDVFAVRELPLSFSANGARLIEAGVFNTDNERGVVVFIPAPTTAGATSASSLGGSGSQSFFILNGAADPVRRMNAGSKPRIDTTERVRDYTRFFLAAFHSDEGQFNIVERTGEILWRKDAPKDVVDRVAKQLVPVAVQSGANGNWIVDGTVIYGQSLMTIHLTLQPDGSIPEDKEQRIQDKLPIMAERFVDGIKVLRDAEDTTIQLADTRRRVEADPSNRDALVTLSDLLTQRQLWAEAVDIQKQLVDLLQADHTPESDTRLTAVYQRLSWTQLNSRNFAGALAAAEAGLKLKPGDLWLESDDAYALMFLGHVTEADALYRKNIGKLVPSSGSGPGSLWEAWVLNDFDVLEKRKITQPAMAHIRTWMEDARLVAARQKADANPNDKDAISQWRNLARDYKRWPDAVSAEQRLLKLIQADPAHTKAELLDAYLGLSWYQLFVRDFAGALASTDSGLAIDPTYLPLETNRAHALLFLNRVAAADAIYRGNIGKKMPGSGDAWETVILDDLKQLEAGGLKHPEIARLRTLMSAARK